MSPRFARRVLRLFGWQVQGEIPESVRKFIIIAAPHTSWWDFPLGLLARAAVGRMIYFLGKAALFKPPLGWIMRRLGGYPVDRTKRTKMVEQVVELYRIHDDFAIALAPEGTRRRVSAFRTGFYYIATGARIPIICVRFDYQQRVVNFGLPFYPTGDKDRDLETLWKHFAGVRGKRPGKGIAA